MENTLIFASEKEVQFGKLLKFIIPTYLTSLFNTVYTIIDGIFVSAYVGTNALAAINIVYPIVNVLTGIALVFATGGSAVAALHIGGNRKEEASHAFSVSSVAAVLLSCLVSLIVLTNLSTILSLLGATDVTIAGCKTYALWWLWATPVVIGKELFTYFIRVDGSPAYSFVTALSGGVLNIVLDYVLVGRMHMGIYGATLATILGLVLSFLMGIYYFARKHKALSFTLHPLEAKAAQIGEFSLEWLAGQTLLLQNRTQRQGQYILQELEKRHIQPAEILESSNIRAAAALAANGYGIGFLSGELLEHLELDIPFGAYPLQDCALHIESVAAWRTGDYLPRYAQAFIKLMEQV